MAKAHQQAHSANASLSSIQQEKTDLEMEVWASPSFFVCLFVLRRIAKIVHLVFVVQLSGLQQEVDKRDEEYEILRAERQVLKDAYQTLLDELQIHTGQSVQDERLIKTLTQSKNELEEVVQANMEHIATLEENLRKMSAENETGLTPLIEENTLLREQQRLQAKEHETTAQTIQELRAQVQLLKLDAEKKDTQLAFEKGTVSELSVKLKERKEERQQLVESFEETLEQTVTELKEEHEAARVR